MLSFLVFLPLIGLLLIWGSPARFARSINVLTCGVALVINLILAFGMKTWDGYSHYVQVDWISAIGVHYEIGVDGLGMVLLLLTTFVSLVSAIASWRIEKYQRGYHMMFLLLLTGMLGVFVALDLFLFYIFWEIMLLPMYFLIGIWGGPNRKYASIKFFLYTLAGSVLLLAGVLITVFQNATDTGLVWSIVELSKTASVSGDLVAGGVGLFCFIGMFIGFAVKVPCFPFHTWLPDAHVEAPTPISMILAGVLLKMGGYGMIRIAWPFFPDAAAVMGTAIAAISVIAIVYGAFVAMGQTDFKKMIAYSSVSHMGFVTLGLVAGTPEAINGAMYMMLAHGTISAMLFMIVGVIYDRAHHRDMDRFGGLAWNMPKYFVLASFAFFASLGLPGMSGFIAEFTTFTGTFASHLVDPVTGDVIYSYRWAAFAALLGVVLTGAYYLIALQKIYLGKTPKVYTDPKTYPDVSLREKLVLVPLAAVTLWMGVMPAVFMDMYKPFTDDLAVTITNAMKAMGG
ncbi:MAG: NADH-quinone oxidoreductase subunit M [Planctomycetota bacterium]|nr:NADH-quinone oxidoreductase subunit M [Planctomycetota bacterium]